MSRLSDISGIGKDRGKGTTPKDTMPENCIPGHTVKNCMTADGFPTERYLRCRIKIN